MSKQMKASVSIAEMKEFASFPAATQRYVRRSLDVAEGRPDVVERWARDDSEVIEITAQARIYARLPALRDAIPETSSLVSVEPLIGPLVSMVAFDLGRGRIPGFPAFRFLYERLLGGRARPWLPSAFMAAAGLPLIAPPLRGSLLKSLSEAAATAAGWADRDAVFHPSWVEKVEA